MDNLINADLQIYIGITRHNIVMQQIPKWEIQGFPSILLLALY